MEHVIYFVKKQHVYLEVKDHSVSKETFQLKYNESLELLETSPQPSTELLPKYYKSDDYISHTNTKRNVFENIYHQVRKIALKQKLKLINSFNSDEKNILDIGCGTGDFLQLAGKNNWKITGIEPDDNARAIANKKTSNVVFDVAQLSKFKPHSFDVISLWHVLEHLPNLEAQVSIFKKLLKPKGRLIIAVPNYKSYDALYYKSNWAAFDVPRHLWHFSQTSICKLFLNKQMVIEKIAPMKFDAYYVSLLSEKYKHGRMHPIRAFWIGFKSNLLAKRTSEYSSLIYVIKNK